MRTIASINDIDQKILTQLEQNGYSSVASIARSLGLGERSVRRRLRSLIAAKIIVVTAVPNPVLCGFSAWSAISVKVSTEHLDNVTRTLVKNPSVYFLAHALGRIDLVIAVFFNTYQELASFINIELVNIKGVEKVDSWLYVIPRKYYHFSWPASFFEKTRELRVSPGKIPFSHIGYEITDLDRRILNILRLNGLARPASIASQLGVGVGAVRKHINNMLAHEVYKLEIVQNPEILSGQVWATIGISVNGRSVHDIIDSIVRQYQVHMAAVSLGRFNIVVSARFPNNDALNHFLTQDLPPIRGIVSTETFVHNKPIKYQNVVWPQM
ncbi:Lrp/AsnC ligand binding domain-containing protein [Chloroflexota bacterium]